MITCRGVLSNKIASHDQLHGRRKGNPVVFPGAAAGGSPSSSGPQTRMENHRATEAAGLVPPGGGREYIMISVYL